jgi:TonB family protein
MRLKMPSKKTIVLNILLICTITLSSQDVWEKEVFLNIENKSLKYALTEIRKQTDLNLIYNSNLIDEKLLTVNINSTTESVIKKILTFGGYSYKKFDNNSCVIYKNVSSPKKFKAVVRKESRRDNNSQNNSVVERPVLVSKIDFKYPMSAINEKLEGEVIVNILINKKGDVSRSILEESSGHRILDTAALNYVKKLKYIPAEYNGKLKEVWTSLLVKFNFE